MRAYEARMWRIGATVSMTVGLVAAAAIPAGAHGQSNTPPPVTTCAALGAGSVGNAVKTIQKAIGTDTDGDFGPMTQKALEKWQKAQGVPTTGVVDAATWAALPAKAATTACGQRVSGTGVTPTCTALGAGSTGLAVIVLQRALAITADGAFGPGTAAALTQAQRDAELPADGTTDAATWKVLHKFGTPACSTKRTVGPQQSKDAKAQARIRAQVQQQVATLQQHPGNTKNPVALQAMAWGKKQIGKPYIYGGVGPKGFDCSGLQLKAYQHAGLTIPRVAAAQYAGAGTQIPLDQAHAGDLLFFASDVANPATVYHVSMYVGGGQMLEAPHTGLDIRVIPLWTTDLLPVVVRPAAGLTLPLKTGATGWSVSQLQYALARHHYSVPADGGYDATTLAAVKDWQTRHALKPTGVVRMTTWLSLG